MRDLPRFNILLVDDDPESHTLVRKYLSLIENSQYQLDSVYDFDSAISRLRDPSYEYDAILLDHYLGDHTGIEILRELEVAPLVPPVIILTGNDDKKLDAEALSLGASDFLVKTQINPALLDRALRYAMEHRRNERLIVLKQRDIASKLKLAAMGEMASVITHEMDDPLMVIQSRAILIQSVAALNPAIDPKIRDAAMDIILMIQQVTNIKSGLRRQFVTSEGSVAEKVDLRILLSEAIRLSETRRKQARTSVSLSIEAECDFTCRPTEISQVLVTLLNNAAEAVAPLETRWIRLETKCEGGALVISITDSGGGISSQDAEKLFDPFYTSKSDGIGMGLGLSRKIIETHGGTLEIDDSSKNTRFVIRLPLNPMMNLKFSDSLKNRNAPEPSSPDAFH